MSCLCACVRVLMPDRLAQRVHVETLWYANLGLSGLRAACLHAWLVKVLFFLRCSEASESFGYQGLSVKGLVAHGLKGFAWTGLELSCVSGCQA